MACRTRTRTCWSCSPNTSTRGLTDYSAAQPGERDAQHLQQALRSRFAVDQAIGGLMATHGITADQARTTFRQRLAETVADAEQLAHDIITEHIPTTDQTDPEAT